MIFDGMPLLYTPWMMDLLGQGVPKERSINCDTCSMCASPQEPVHPQVTYFRPDLKCCTYWPKLPNFLVGAILASTEPEAMSGRTRVTNLIVAADCATPLGLHAPISDQRRHEHAPDGSFGRDATLRCPFYAVESGGCSIWTYRNSVCATYFCKHDRGAAGLRFWRTIRDLLTSVEQELSLWCLSELELQQDAVVLLVQSTQAEGAQMLRAFDEDWTAETHRRVWGHWNGREREFFEKCSGIVSALEWRDVLSICGPRVRLLADVAAGALAEMKNGGIPERLRLARYSVLACGKNGASQLVTYSQTDPREVSADLLKVLPYFDGRPSHLAREAVRTETGLGMSDDLLRALCDIQLLVDARREGKP